MSTQTSPSTIFQVSCVCGIHLLGQSRANLAQCFSLEKKPFLALKGKQYLGGWGAIQEIKTCIFKKKDSVSKLYQSRDNVNLSQEKKILQAVSFNRSFFIKGFCKIIFFFCIFPRFLVQMSCTLPNSLCLCHGLTPAGN